MKIGLGDEEGDVGKEGRKGKERRGKEGGSGKGRRDCEVLKVEE